MKKPSTKLELFRSIAEYTYDWESWIRPDGALGWVNPAVERITGYSVEECLGMKDYPFGLIHPEDRFAMRRLFRLAAQGGMGNDVEFRVVRKDGAVRWCAVSFQPLLD
ncbi:MAG: PAS domain-containing protein, partial [Myxococcales bacterium]|nr:PAS domain-containing protein [Myxococcales bacterium]